MIPTKNALVFNFDKSDFVAFSDELSLMIELVNNRGHLKTEIKEEIKIDDTDVKKVDCDFVEVPLENLGGAVEQLKSTKNKERFFGFKQIMKMSESYLQNL